MNNPRLLGDIGATHARFALLDGGDITRRQVLMVTDYESLDDAIERYLYEIALPDRPMEAALGVAGPVLGDKIAMMNSGWHLSISALKQRFGWTALHVVNDFVANALAVPHLAPEYLRQVGGGAPAANMPIAVLGPGTGLGVAALVPDRPAWIAVGGEGGNVTLAALDSRE